MQKLTTATLWQAASMIRVDPEMLYVGAYSNYDKSRFCAVGLLAKILGYGMDSWETLRDFQMNEVTPLFRPHCRDETEPTVVVGKWEDSWCIVADYSNYWVAKGQPLRVAELFEKVADRIDNHTVAMAV